MIEGTKILGCPTCGSPAQATGLQQKIMPPNWEYKCLDGHSFYAHQSDAVQRTYSGTVVPKHNFEVSIKTLYDFGKPGVLVVQVLDTGNQKALGTSQPFPASKRDEAICDAIEDMLERLIHGKDVEAYNNEWADHGLSISEAEDSMDHPCRKAGHPPRLCLGRIPMKQT